MSDHPNEPSVDHLDGMTSMWGLLASLMTPLPPHARVTVHPEAVARAEPRPELLELVVDIALPTPVDAETPDEPTLVLVVPEPAAVPPVHARTAPRRRAMVTLPARQRRPRSSNRRQRHLVA